MSRWEYHVVELGRVRKGKIDQALNELGTQGWELVSMFGQAGNLAGGLTKAVAVFKRQTA